MGAGGDHQLRVTYAWATSCIVTESLIICVKKAGHIQSVDDLKHFKGLRTDLHDLFFSVISEIVSRPRYGRQRI